MEEGNEGKTREGEKRSKSGRNKKSAARKAATLASYSRCDGQGCEAGTKIIPESCLGSLGGVAPHPHARTL